MEPHLNPHLAGLQARPGRKAAPIRARAVMPAKSPAAMASAGATQEPPTASTFPSARQEAALSPFTPPVGQSGISGKGSATAWSQRTPPDDSAGKNFRTGKPNAA